MSAIATLHEKLVFSRRVQVLASHLARLLPQRALLLDVGCGDGTIDSLLTQQRPDLSIEGIDVLVRDGTRIPVTPFDGRIIPLADKSRDVVMFIDVLHHTDDPEVLLAEAKRVARQAVVVKDHCLDGLLADLRLRLMDWVGNAHHGVALPYNYWPERQWRTTFNRLDLTVEHWNARLGLYPWPASLLFDQSLHFIASLRP